VILLFGIAAGLAAAWVRARIKKRKLQAVELTGWWLVVLAVLPQALVFGQLGKRLEISERLVPFFLTGSLLVLIVFAWFNIRKPGFQFLALGLMLNCIVIIANGGWMPIAPRTIQQMDPSLAPQYAEAGQRLGFTKDWIMNPEDTILPILSDRITLPVWLGYPVAFSTGDVFIALGAFLFLYSLADEAPHRSKEHAI